MTIWTSEPDQFHTTGICPWCREARSLSALTRAVEIENPKRLGIHGPIRYRILRCNSCLSGILYEEYEIFVIGYGKSLQKHLYPSNLPVPVDERIPEDIRNPFYEARLCFEHHAHNAAACVARKALQRLCIKLGASKEERWLSKQLKHLVENGKITRESFDLAMAVKIVGDEGAHLEDVSPEDVQEALDLLDHLTDRIFIRIPKAKEITDRAQQRRQEKEENSGNA